MNKHCVLGLLLSLLLVCHQTAAFAQPNSDPTEAGADYLAGIIIFSADLDRSIKFYTDVMGLKVVGRVPKNGKLHEVLLSKSGRFLNGMMLTLQSSEEPSTRSTSDLSAYGQILFMTSSNTIMADRLKAAGREVTFRDPQHLFTTDPDGYRLMIYEVDPHMISAAK